MNDFDRNLINFYYMCINKNNTPPPPPPRPARGHRFVVFKTSDIISARFLWIAEFKRERTSCIDVHRSGRPNDLTTEKIHKIIVTNRCKLQF